MFIIREIISYFFIALELLIIARVIIDIVQPNPYGSLPRRGYGRGYYAPRNPLVNLVYVVSEPILAPLRRVIPPMGMFDITPMVAIIVIVVVRSLVLSLLPL
jgi:hypothetical protein